SRRAVAALPVMLNELATHFRCPEALQMVDRACDGFLRILAVVEICRDLVRHANQLVYIHSPPTQPTTCSLPSRARRKSSSCSSVNSLYFCCQSESFVTL